MFLFTNSSPWVRVTEDEMNFVCGATSIRTKHESVRGLVIELRGKEIRVLSQKFDISSSTLQSLLEFHFVLKDETLSSRMKWRSQNCRCSLVIRKKREML